MSQLKFNLKIWNISSRGGEAGPLGPPPDYALVPAQTSEEGVKPVRTRGRGQFFTILFGRLLWTAHNCKFAFNLLVYLIIRICHVFIARRREIAILHSACNCNVNLNSMTMNTLLLFCYIRNLLFTCIKKKNTNKSFSCVFNNQPWLQRKWRLENASKLTILVLSLQKYSKNLALYRVGS